MPTRGPARSGQAVLSDRPSRTRAPVPVLLVVVLALGLLGAAVSPAVAAPAAPPGFVPVLGSRLLDARADPPGTPPVAGATPALDAGEMRTLPVAGRAPGVPATGVGAVVVTVTATALDAPASVRVWPSDRPVPEAEDVALPVPGVPVSRTVVTPLGANGALSVLSAGRTTTSVDLVGWTPAGAATPGLAESRRVLDTRPVGGGPATPLQPGEVRTVPLGPSVPPGSSVLLQVTGLATSAPTTIAVGPTGSPVSPSPALGFVPGRGDSNVTAATVGPDGAVAVRNGAGVTDLALDVRAVMAPTSGTALAPSRVFDTRVPSGDAAASGPLQPGQVRTIPVLGRGGVPQDGVSAVLVNVTGIQPPGPAAIGMWGPGAPPRSTAVVVPGGSTAYGFATVPVDPDGAIRIAAAGSGTDATVDVVGWLPGTPVAAPASAVASTDPGVPAAAAPVPGSGTDGGLVGQLARATALPAVSRNLLFDGDVTRGLGAYSVQACRDDSVRVVDDPLGTGRKVARFTVRDSDVAPCTPTENPRAQIVSPNIIREGGDYWIGWSTLFPQDFPAWPGRGWLTFESIYGPPYNDSGPRHMALLGDPERIVWQRGSTYGYDVPWSMPMVRGRWVDFVVHQVQSEDPAVGSVELWVNVGRGWERQRFADGSERLMSRTVDQANNAGPNTSDVRLYFQRGMYDQATLYHAEHRVGSDFASVAPRSYVEQGGRPAP